MPYQDEGARTAVLIPSEDALHRQAKDMTAAQIVQVWRDWLEDELIYYDGFCYRVARAGFNVSWMHEGREKHFFEFCEAAGAADVAATYNANKWRLELLMQYYGSEKSSWFVYFAKTLDDAFAKRRRREILLTFERQYGTSEETIRQLLIKEEGFRYADKYGPSYSYKRR